MNKFTQIDCIRVGKEIEEHLKPYANKHGITIRARGGTFTDSGMNLGLEMVIGKGIPRPQVPIVLPVAPPAK